MFQELVAKDRSNKKRTCIIVGLIAIGAIIVLVAAIVITSGNGAAIRPGASKGTVKPGARSSIALEDFLEGHMIPRAFNATWISGKLFHISPSGYLNYHLYTGRSFLFSDGTLLKLGTVLRNSELSW